MIYQPYRLKMFCEICFKEFNNNTFEKDFYKIDGCDHSYCKYCYQ